MYDNERGRVGNLCALGIGFIAVWVNKDRNDKWQGGFRVAGYVCSISPMQHESK